ncbi:MAG: hypothetical protein N2Z80_07745 [Hydrogenothermaceae bacterium]|nr:hypothetical protein [Hydrogenothermaceae bacterium]
MKTASYGVRLLTSLSVITTLLVYNYDFKIPLTVLSLIYILQYMILSPFSKDPTIRYFLYLADFGFISYSAYVTDQVYILLFLFTILATLREKLDLALFLTTTFALSGFFFYRTGFYDFNLIYLSLALLVVVYMILKEIGSKDKTYQNLLELTKSIYRDNLICSDRMDFYLRYYEITSSLRELKEGSISLDSCVEVLYENLNCDGIFITDRENLNTVCKGKYSCDTNMVNLVQELEVEEIKRLLSVKFVIVREIGKYTIVILYKNYVLIDKELLETMS